MGAKPTFALHLKAKKVTFFCASQTILVVAQPIFNGQSIAGIWTHPDTGKFFVPTSIVDCFSWYSKGSIALFAVVGITNTHAVNICLMQTTITRHNSDTTMFRKTRCVTRLISHPKTLVCSFCAQRIWTEFNFLAVVSKAALTRRTTKHRNQAHVLATQMQWQMMSPLNSTVPFKPLQAWACLNLKVTMEHGTVISDHTLTIYFSS
jgi:hypothetical protein